MSAFINNQDGEFLLGGRHACQTVNEMLTAARKRKQQRRDEQCSKERSVGWFSYPEPLTEYELNQCDADELLEAHEELPYTLEAYLAWTSNHEIHTYLIHAMRAELKGGDLNIPRVMELFDQARDFIRRCALERIDISISL